MDLHRLGGPIHQYTEAPIHPTHPYTKHTHTKTQLLSCSFSRRGFLRRISEEREGRERINERPRTGKRERDREREIEIDRER